MTKKITPATANVAKPTAAKLALKSPAKVDAKPLAKAPLSKPVELTPLEMHTTALARQAREWLNPDSDPRRNVADYRAFTRSHAHSWPTVLTLNPVAFEDLINHPDAIALLSAIQLERSYDVRHPAQAALLLASWFGIKSICISADEPSASMS